MKFENERLTNHNPERTKDGNNKNYNTFDLPSSALNKTPASNSTPNLNKEATLPLGDRLKSGDKSEARPAGVPSTGIGSFSISKSTDIAQVRPLVEYSYRTNKVRFKDFDGYILNSAELDALIDGLIFARVELDAARYMRENS